MLPNIAGASLKAEASFLEFKFFAVGVSSVSALPASRLLSRAEAFTPLKHLPVQSSLCEDMRRPSPSCT